MREFDDFGTRTAVQRHPAVTAEGRHYEIECHINEFWTAKQRDANSLHEVSYRACFKPQLPRFFIERLTKPGDTVYDPFMGRGTTLIEAALLGRIPHGNDVNPLSAMLVRPRLEPPTPEQITGRSNELDLKFKGHLPKDLLIFYHPHTLREICALRKYLLDREAAGKADAVDRWIRMVAINRLTGHSPGFFSVYTMPPNQAVSVAAQRKINERRGQTPPVRPIKPIILKKSRGLLADLDFPTLERMRILAHRSLLLTSPADATPAIPDRSVDLVVTSPPFLDVVDYAADNWLRCWFAGIDPDSVALTVPKKLTDWKSAMRRVFAELRRVLKPGGHIAFEVGEVRDGKVKLEETVLECGIAAGLCPQLILINAQKFTKTSNCWGVANGKKGTNTNRIVVFRRRLHH
ncbi:site-specific DNA-methyltransferase [Candidatus Sumerlaeota bacterium]|nr:site-specific DNA-methyltransferase [Candidatus Sumerlaeota bacterium]